MWSVDPLFQIGLEEELGGGALCSLHIPELFTPSSVLALHTLHSTLIYIYIYIVVIYIKIYIIYIKTRV